ncbi:MAG: class I SAM-dependent methyltransferase [Chloroflexi bacterium]|nr:class I SAM-dependent methyltransferase [Chloroflexota bacterium]
MSDYLNHQVNIHDPAFVAHYDELPLWSAYAGALLLRHVPLRRGCVALDIGCGAGFPLLELAQRLGAGSHVYGVDPWEAALDRARAKARQWQVANVTLIPGDAASLPLPNESIDLIVSNLGVNNLADGVAVFAECRRVARPGAVVALTTNLQGHMQEFYTVAFAALESARADHLIPRLQRHIEQRATIPALAAALEAAGFQMTRTAEETAELRFADGSAMLRHWFIKLAFLPAWRDALAGPDMAALFSDIEARLNAHARHAGELRLSIPLAYLEARA